MSDKLDLIKSKAKKLIFNPFVIIIAIFGIIMYFIFPSSPRKSVPDNAKKVEYKIDSFENMITGNPNKKEEEITNDEEEELALLGELEEKPKKMVINVRKNPEAVKKEPTITEEYAEKINKILQASKQRAAVVQKPSRIVVADRQEKPIVRAEDVLKNVYNMLNARQTGVISYINQNLLTKNIIGERSQLIKIRGEIPVVCETAKLLCEERITERVPQARCITLYKNCVNPKDYQEITLEEYRSYKK